MRIPQFTLSASYQQAGLIPLARRRLRNQVGWKRIVKVAKAKLGLARIRVWHGFWASGCSYSCPHGGLSSLSSTRWVCCFALILFAQEAQACPGVVSFHDLEGFSGGLRKDLRLFALTSPPVGHKLWKQLAFQVDPLTPDGRLVFAPGEDLSLKSIEPSDLLTFQVEDFDRPMGPGSPPLPCRSSSVYEISLEGRAAYLTSCDPSRQPPVRFSAQVTFDPEQNTLESAMYRYRFHSDNYMQFANIAFRRPSGGWDDVAHDSRLLIRADIKNFFTMRFDSQQIVSRLEASRLSPVGNLARLSFYLRILLFKIRMSLATDVGFYSDSGHIPMQVDLPVNAYERLRAGSGILYSWRLAEGAGNEASTLHMPRLDPDQVHLGFKDLAKLGLGYCHGDHCLFRYSVTVHGRQLSMDMDLRRALVERGFFPMYVANTRMPSKAMGWGLDDEEEVNRMGMYFEVSGLPEGGHPWDFWLRLGAPETSQLICPRPVVLRAVK